MNNADKLARPILKASKEQGNVISHEYEGGLSKREAFAMAAMQGVLADGAGNNFYEEQIADMSVRLADALLEKLED